MLDNLNVDRVIIYGLSAGVIPNEIFISCGFLHSHRLTVENLQWGWRIDTAHTFCQTQNNNKRDLICEL